jgi:hypothetical protein
MPLDHNGKAVAQQQRADEELRKRRVRAMTVINETLLKRLRRFTDTQR